MSALEVRPDLKDHLANHSVIGRIREGLVQAQRGEFVTDGDIEAFFVGFTDPSVGALCAGEAMKWKLGA